MERLTEMQARHRKKGEESSRKAPREIREAEGKQKRPGETPTPPGARDDARCQPTRREM